MIRISRGLGTIEQAVTDLQRHFTEVQANVEGLTKRLGKTQAMSAIRACSICDV